MNSVCAVVRTTTAAAVAALGACASPPPPPAEELPPTTADAPRLAQPIADGRWELVASSLTAGGPPPGDRRPTLEFRDGRIAAFSGCNRAVGDAVDAEGRLAVGRLATTRMACPGPLAAFEQQFFGLIEAEPVLRYEGDVLLLIDGKEQARFRRADSAPGVRP